ncbi:LexA family protein [Edwardsiella tarda]|uniref:LexA family protein n=1 Tax=Edwardsiella tarda TaxID=636 RepID=UPI00351C956C
MTMTTMGSRILKRRKELKLSQVTLSKAVGVSNVAISQWERDETAPRGDALLALARELLCPAEYLVNGTPADTPLAIPVALQPKGKYPLLSWTLVNHGSLAIRSYTREKAEHWYSTTVDCSAASFWLTVEGDSMTATAGLSIPEGTAILVDPDRNPTNGKLVVAASPSGDEAIFKRYILDVGKKYLKPLNTMYSMVEINDNYEIIGVVVEARIAIP